MQHQPGLGRNPKTALVLTKGGELSLSTTEMSDTRNVMGSQPRMPDVTALTSKPEMCTPESINAGGSDRRADLGNPKIDPCALDSPDHVDGVYQKGDIVNGNHDCDCGVESCLGFGLYHCWCCDKKRTRRVAKGPGRNHYHYLICASIPPILLPISEDGKRIRPPRYVWYDAVMFGSSEKAASHFAWCSGHMGATHAQVVSPRIIMLTCAHEAWSGGAKDAKDCGYVGLIVLGEDSDTFIPIHTPIPRDL